jgi:arginine-tRNA-protein transferase
MQDDADQPLMVSQFEGTPTPCPYLDPQTSILPLTLPHRILTGEEFDQFLEAGHRRSGPFLYRTKCPACSACEPTRLPLKRFHWTTSLRRVFRKGSERLRVEVGAASADERRVELYNRHKTARGMSDPESLEDIHGYRDGFVQSCCMTVELSFWDEKELIGCTILDVGRKSLSAVYTFFDPRFSDLSPGTFSILQQIAWGQANQFDYLYLGLFVAGNRHLRYKARFTPQERLIEGRWQLLSEAIEDWAAPTLPKKYEDESGN